jgi:hypothetical protein
MISPSAALLALLCGTGDNVMAWCVVTVPQMTIVVVPKFNFEGMLKSIVRHRISHLM